MTNFVLLPEHTPGLATYSRERDGRDQYGVPDVIVALVRFGELWEKTNPGRPIAVGDISRPKGGAFPPHGAHRNGNEVDFRPFRTDGKNALVTHAQSAYSRPPRTKGGLGRRPALRPVRP